MSNIIDSFNKQELEKLKLLKTSPIKPFNVGDLVIRTEAEMLKTANFGRKSLNELKENLKSMSLSFGMKLVNWPPKNLDELLKIKNKEF